MGLLEQKLKNIEWLLLDVDGVLTDGKLYYSEKGEIIKVFSVLDGHGIKLIKSIGMKVGVISGRGCKALENRLKELDVDWFEFNAEDKKAAIEKGVALHGNEVLNSAHVGDDLPDLDVFNLVQVSVSPNNAHQDVLDRSDIKLDKSGGNGAVREICDLIFSLKTND